MVYLCCLRSSSWVSVSWGCIFPTQMGYRANRKSFVCFLSFLLFFLQRKYFIYVSLPVLILFYLFLCLSPFFCFWLSFWFFSCSVSVVSTAFVGSFCLFHQTLSSLQKNTSSLSSYEKVPFSKFEIRGFRTRPWIRLNFLSLVKKNVYANKQSVFNYKGLFK